MDILKRNSEGETQISPGINADSRQPMSDDPVATKIRALCSPLIKSETDTELPTETMPQNSVYETALGASAFPIHQSIEDDQLSSAEEQGSDDSKASSSGQSVEGERPGPHVDGQILPNYAILGPDEYALALPAEGKIQSVYFDTINNSRKRILKYIHRHDSVGSSNSSPKRTIERNDMMELVQRLNDTTTHLDLGLPGFLTKSPTGSEEQAAFAHYASSKFAFLGHLVDLLRRTDCSIVIFAQSGPIQTLLEDYLLVKGVHVRRPENSNPSSPHTTHRLASSFKVDLWNTTSSNSTNLIDRPVLMIAFDASFDAQHPTMRELREKYSSEPGILVPVVHLLIANSAEHVSRCLPRSMPSPQRSKLLVRATYLARTNLGGSPTYVPKSSDEPDGRPMDISDFQRAVRKSPDRKLLMLASLTARAALSDNFDDHWNIPTMPELQLEDMDDSPPKSSDFTTTTIGTPKDGIAISRTPISRADTPSGRKRQLDVDGLHPILAKRQRLTPLQDTALETQTEQLKSSLKALQAELTAEKDARKEADQKRDYVQNRLGEFTISLADLQRRYEKRMQKSRELSKTQKKLVELVENNKSRQDKTITENGSLKAQIAQLEIDLTTARTEMKSGTNDLSTLERVREDLRTMTSKTAALEKSLENTKRDFEFTRSQYQEASNKAADFAIQVGKLEEEVTALTAKASDEQYRLKERNFHESLKKHLARIDELELEKKGFGLLLKRMEDETKVLKKGRGVQTRGSSVQPTGSPGPRSRQGSPAASGLLVPPHAGNRASVLRHER